MAIGAEQRGEWLQPPAEDIIELGEAPAWVEQPVRRRWPAFMAGAALVLLGIAWIAGLIYLIAQAAPAGGIAPLKIAAWVGVGSAPLALLAIIAVLFLRTGRSEATAYMRAARELRGESARLAEMLGLLTRKIDAARAGLAEQGGALAQIGAETSLRLGSAGAQLREEASAFARTAQILDDATATARTDLGVLMADLPDTAARATALTERLRDLGEAAEAHADALGSRLVAIETQARAADQGSVAAARRLAIELERIEGSAAAADRRIADAAGKLGLATESALGDTADALDQMRRAVTEQSNALLATIAQGRGALGATGDEASRALAGRFDALAARMIDMNGRLQAHEGAARGLLEQLDGALGSVEARFERFGDTGAERAADLAEALVALAEHSDQLGAALATGTANADALATRVGSLRTQIEQTGGQLADDIPAALARVRMQAGQSLEAIDAALPKAARLVEDAAALEARLGAGGGALDDQARRLEALGAAAEERLAALSAQAEAFEALAARAGAEAHALADGASGRLGEALEQVRVVAARAAGEAREALVGAIPAAAAALASASAREMAAALRDVGRDQIAAVGVASAEAAAVAGAATDHLNRHLLTVAETTRALEERMEEHRAAAEATSEQAFARQVSLLIEALNSTAIDVAKIFSNEPTDAAWAAYLRGDRGVFTRRAVRLLNGNEARTIAARYNEDSEFRDQVNRYIHDFESMLRRVLGVRDGSAMGVALLSSDTGKLYVALAQAIERLRR